jgi:hypothetical protein
VLANKPFMGAIFTLVIGFCLVYIAEYFIEKIHGFESYQSYLHFARFSSLFLPICLLVLLSLTGFCPCRAAAPTTYQRRPALMKKTNKKTITALMHLIYLKMQ